PLARPPETRRSDHGGPRQGQADGHRWAAVGLGGEGCGEDGKAEQPNRQGGAGRGAESVVANLCQPSRPNQRPGGGGEDSDKEEQPGDAKLDQRLEVGVVDGLPYAEGAGRAEVGAGAGIEAGEMKI